MNGVEAWVFALRGEYRYGGNLAASDFDSYDLIILNLNIEILPHYRRLLRNAVSRRATVIGLYEGDLGRLHSIWKEWSSVADLTDLIVAIHPQGVSMLGSLTSTPVHHIGIPYPVDGVREQSVDRSARTREIFLCARPLDRPLDYLAARPLDLPMYAYETTFSRRPRELLRHRSLDKAHYTRQAADRYADPGLTVLPHTHLFGYFERVARSLLWMNLDPRRTWARYIIDAASLGVPVVTTLETGHGPILFPELIVESPYDIAGATRIARRLLEDEGFYCAIVERAAGGLEWYRPEQTLARLWEALGRVSSQ